jgi:predicted glycoside hydrolase/deacetylase ChbG (UPF0249 family)
MNDNPIRIITRVDDMGVASNANRAIVETLTRGIARNVSVLAGAPFFEEAAELLQGVQGIDVGVHYALNAEWDNLRWGPVLPPEQVRSLLDEHSHFFKTTMELHQHGANPDQMLAEARAQIQRARAFGLNPAYFDIHMGVDWVGKVSGRLAKLCEEEGLIYAQPIGGPLPKPPDEVKEEPNRFVAQLECAEPGLYTCVGHPMYDDEEARPFALQGSPPGQVGRDRDGQRRMFTDARVLAVVAQRAIRPIRYSEA